MRINVSLTAGALARGEMRRTLNRLMLHDYLDSWKEEKGFLTSEFYIKGIDEEAWNRLNNWMAAWNDRNKQGN